MADVLNPYLYSRLARLFGPVKVSRRGESWLATAVRDIESHDKRLLVAHAGEYYQVCCPYCNDTRHRLYVNHMYGQVDGHGRRMTFLAVCYNEHCLDRDENRRDFRERMEDTGLLEATVRVGRAASAEARTARWPGPCTPLADLPATHPAVTYVRDDRGFDPVALSRDFGVCFCTDSRYTLAKNRIIVPVFDCWELKGWQARYVGDLDWKGPRRKELPPKYFSCPDSDFRSKCLYNFDRMKEWETGVIVEGPTDAWRFGSMSGCVFGNTVTDLQWRRFAAAFRGRTGVLLLDPEEFGSKTTARLLDKAAQTMPGRFCAVRLPPGTDPGSLDRDFLKAYVKEQAAAQGVKVTYRKAVKRDKRR